DFIDGLVFEHTPARHVLVLGRALAPCRKLHDDRLAKAGFAGELQALPGLRGIKGIGLRIGQNRDFLLEPAFAAGLLETLLQLDIDIAQMCYVAQRIVELAGSEGTNAPIDGLIGLIVIALEKLLDEGAIRDRLSVPKRHGRNLGVE